MIVKEVIRNEKEKENYFIGKGMWRCSSSKVGFDGYNAKQSSWLD